jgi:hypothetical protein
MSRALKRAELAAARPGGEHTVAARAVVRLSHARRQPNDMDWFGRLSGSDDEFADDDYFADLRDALDDPKPLGPRDEPVTEPVSYESFALPAAEGGVEAAVEPAVGPVRRRAHAKVSSQRRRIIRASQWIRNASAVVLAADLLTLARHAL